MKRHTRTFIVLVVCGLLAGLSLALAAPSLGESPATFDTVEFEQQASYKEVTYEEMIGSADFVFVGRVEAISPTRWNQDSGEFWLPSEDSSEAVLQLHTLTLAVSQVMANRVGFDHQAIEITVWGRSPSEEKSDYKLETGTEILVFAKQVELAWRGGRKTVFRLMGAPAATYLTKGADGLYYGQILQEGGGTKRPVSLEEVAADIAQVRQP